MLTDAVTAWKAGDEAASARRILAYFDQKTWPEALVVQLEPLPASPAAIVEAEAVLADTFTLQGVTGQQPRREDGSLDWKAGGPNDDPEWAWMLNRHHWMLALVAAWQATGEARYAEAVDTLLADWIRANPYPGRPSYSAAWRPLEAARRIDASWFEVWVKLRDSGFLSPETRLLFLASLLDHADSLRRFHSPGGNHRLTERVMLAKLAIWFPEFKDAAKWVDEARADVLAMMKAQVYPDGAYVELANHYQLIAAGGFRSFFRLFSATGRTSEVTALEAPLRGMYDYIAGVMRPSGFGPLNNDSDLDPNDVALGKARDLFPEFDALADLRAAKGAAGSRFFPFAGQLITRDGFGPDALWGFFDAGPQGSQHEHLDRLHLSVSVGKQDFLVDNGRYHYVPGRWREYFKGPRGHNVVLLNGEGTALPPRKVTKPLSVPNRITPQYAFAEAEASFADSLGGSEAWHRRAVWFFPGDGWIVRDRIDGFGANTITTLWHFHPEVSVELEGERTLLAQGGGKQLLMQSIVARGSQLELSLVAGREGIEPAGWYSPTFNVRLPAIQMEAVQRSLGPVEHLWLIAPSRAALKRLEEQLSDLPGKAPQL
ncbi:MAG: alginate lyase family protein [Opitutales bacterium]